MSKNTLTNDFTSLDIDLLSENPENSRAGMDAARLEGLAMSIRRHGVRMPLEVREIPVPEGEIQMYEVVTGNRRLRASQRVCADLLAEGDSELLAKRRVVPVRILSAAEALEANERKYLELIENLQREDISPLDEALAFRWLVECHHDTPSSLASTLGLGRSHIYNRLKLPDAPKILLDAMSQGLVGAKHCELVGGIPGEAEREGAAHMVLHPQGRWAWKTEPLTAEETKEMIREMFMVSLKPTAKPGFDLDDESLVPDAGACGPCPHRAENAEDVRVATYRSRQRGIDLMTCLNPACARAKRTATLRRMAERTRSEVLSEEAAATVFAGLGGAIVEDADYVPLDAIGEGLAGSWDGPTYMARNPATGETVVLVDREAAADLRRATMGRRSLDASVSESIWDRDGEWAEGSAYLPLSELSEEQRKAWTADVYVARNLVTGVVHDLIAKADLVKFLKGRSKASGPRSTRAEAVEGMDRLMEAIWSQGMTEADIDALTATELQETPAALEMFRAWLKPAAKEDGAAIEEMMQVIGAKGAGASTAYLAIAILSYGLRERGTADPAYRAFAERFGVK